jgi:hypothetical protein
MATRAVLSGWKGLVLLLSAILATSPYTAVLANAQPAVLLAVVSLAVMLADARPAALLALASYALVLADARPAAFLALSSLVHSKRSAEMSYPGAAATCSFFVIFWIYAIDAATVIS